MLAASAAPSPQAFRALFDEHAAFVWRVLARHGVPSRDLPDGVQEVFLVVHRKLAEFEGRSTLKSWLYGIAARVALGMRRKVHHQRELMCDELPEATEEASQAARAEQRQTLELIERALGELSEDKREVFALYELEGMTLAEVARALGVPANTALYRLYGAREEVLSFVKKRSADRHPQSAGLVGGRAVR